MIRPFALIGFTYLITLMVAIYFGFKVSIALAILSLILFIVCLFFKDIREKKVIPIAILTSALAFGIFSFYYNKDVKPVEALNDKDAVISGTICDSSYEAYGRYYYVIKTDSIDIDGVKQNVKIRMSSSTALDADVYDKITAKVHFFLPDDGQGFSSKTYYASKGIHILSYIYQYDEFNITPTESKPIYYYIIKVRNEISSTIQNLLPTNHAQVARALILGEKHGLSDTIKSDFRNIGVAHVIAVSGMHMAIVSQFAMMLFCFFKIPKRWSALLASFCVLFFVFMLGFVPSVIRAGVMSIIYLLGICIMRQSDSLNSLGLAALVVTIINPFSAGDIGMLLSFSATLGIILLAKPIENFIKSKSEKLVLFKNVFKKLASVLAMTLAATIFTMPIIIISFGRISLISPISNILIVLPVTIIMQLMILAILISFIPFINFLAMPLALISGIIINYVLGCASLLAKIPMVSVSVKQGFMFIWIFATILLIVISFLFSEKYKGLLKMSAVLSAIILMAGIFSYQLSVRNVTYLSVLDVGNGSSIILNKNGHAAVISCGGNKINSEKVSDYLDKYNINKIDYILMSEEKDGSSLYFKDVVSSYDTSMLVMAENENMVEKFSEGISKCKKIVSFNENANIELWGNVSVLAERVEDRSWVHINIDGKDILVCPSGGDTNSLEENYRNCDVFIAGGLPMNYGNINSLYTILSMDKETANDYIKPLLLKGIKPIATAGDGTVSLSFAPDNTVTIRRDL